MKKTIRKWTLRILASGLFIATLLLTILLYPFLTYANKTVYKNYTIYYNASSVPLLQPHLDEATVLLKRSELYNDKLKLDICLNDGSPYPALMRVLRGQAFAWGFYNKVVLQGTMHCQDNYVELNGYKWNLTQLLAHEMTHCLQFDKFGFWHSKPAANIDNWKWEGYAEYIARQQTVQTGLRENLNRLNTQNADTWHITLDDSTITSRAYFQYWINVQYCMEIKKMNYRQLLEDTSSEKTIKNEMINWYNSLY